MAVTINSNSAIKNATIGGNQGLEDKPVDVTSGVPKRSWGIKPRPSSEPQPSGNILEGSSDVPADSISQDVSVPETVVQDEASVKNVQIPEVKNASSSVFQAKRNGDISPSVMQGAAVKAAGNVLGQEEVLNKNQPSVTSITATSGGSPSQPQKRRRRPKGTPLRTSEDIDATAGGRFAKQVDVKKELQDRADSWTASQEALGKVAEKDKVEPSVNNSVNIPASESSAEKQDIPSQRETSKSTYRDQAAWNSRDKSPIGNNIEEYLSSLRSLKGKDVLKSLGAQSLSLRNKIKNTDSKKTDDKKTDDKKSFVKSKTKEDLEKDAKDLASKIRRVKRGKSVYEQVKSNPRLNGSEQDLAFVFDQKMRARNLVNKNKRSILNDLNLGSASDEKRLINKLEDVITYVHPDFMQQETLVDDSTLKTLAARVSVWLDNVDKSIMHEYVISDASGVAVPYWLLSYSIYEVELNDGFDPRIAFSDISHFESLLEDSSNSDLVSFFEGIANVSHTASLAVIPSNNLKKERAAASESVAEAKREFDDRREAIRGNSTKAEIQRKRASEKQLNKIMDPFGYKQDTGDKDTNGKYVVGKSAQAIIDSLWEDFFTRAARNGKQYFDKENPNHIALAKWLILEKLGIEPGSNGRYFKGDEEIFLTPYQLQDGMELVLASLEKTKSNPNPLAVSDLELDQIDRISVGSVLSMHKKRADAGKVTYRSYIRGFALPVEMYPILEDVFEKFGGMSAQDYANYEASTYKWYKAVKGLSGKMKAPKTDWIKAAAAHSAEAGLSVSITEDMYGIAGEDYIDDRITQYRKNHDIPSSIVAENPELAIKMEKIREAKMKRMSKKMKKSNVTRMAEVPLFFATSGRIAGDVLLAGTGVLEKGEATLLAKIESKFSGLKGEYEEDPESISIMAESDDVRDAYVVAYSVAHLYPGAFDDFQEWGRYNNIDRLYSMASLASFVNFVKSNDTRGKGAEFFDNAIDKANEFSRKLIEGDIEMLHKADIRRFIRSLLANGSATSNSDLTMNSLKMMFLDSDPAVTMQLLMDKPDARDALYRQGDYYNARMSPLRMSVDFFFNKHKLMRLALGMLPIPGGSMFPGYTVSAFENILPGFNTGLYLMCVLSDNIAEARKMDPDRRAEIKKSYLEYARGFGLREAMGPHEAGAFKAGLMECLRGDLISGGSYGAKAFLGFIIGMACGLKAPDDDEKKRLIWEYVFDTPWGDVPVKMSWVLDDSIQSSFYTGCILAACVQGLMSTSDASRAIEYGVFETTPGSLGHAAALAELPQLIDYMNMIVAGNTKHTKNYDAFNNLVLRPISKFDNLMISRLRDTFYYSEWDYDPTRYADGSYRVDYAKKNESYDVLWNIWACRSYSCEFLGQLVGLFDGKEFNSLGRDTSYIKHAGDIDLDEASKSRSLDSFRDEVAQAKIDEKLSDLLLEYGFSGNAETVTEDAIKYIWAKHYMGIIEDWSDEHNGDLSGLAAEGYVWKPKDISNMVDVYYSEIDKILDEVNEIKIRRASNEISYTYAKEQKDALWVEYYDLMSKVNDLKSGQITYVGDTYLVRAGTQVYNYDTGEWYNYGDEKAVSQWLPVFSPAERTLGADEYLLGTSDTTMTKVGFDYETNKYNVETEGLEGEDVLNMATSGHRNYVVNKESTQVKDLIDKINSGEEDFATRKADLDEAIDSTRGTGGVFGGTGYASGGYTSGRSSYGGAYYNYSYSGRSSAPNIYSYSRSLNTSKPSTMYSKTPYGTTRRYLTPTVYTSGSSAPYSRRES